MENPVVLITGAQSGIGKAAAFAFARIGARLVISGRMQDDGDRLADELNAIGGHSVFVAADVRIDGDVRALVERTVKEFSRLDVAVNCAGIECARTDMADMDLGSARNVFDVNVFGAMACMKYELRVMTAQRSGSIINFSSIYGSKGYPKYAAYAASKHAIEGLTKSAALEVADKGVRVNAIAPGPIRTEMLDRVAGTSDRARKIEAGLPTRRFGEPDEVNEAIMLLALGRANYITGHILKIDGGLSAI